MNVVALFGNGQSGKTTVLKLFLAAVLERYKGEVTVVETSSKNLSPSALRKEIDMFEAMKKRGEDCDFHDTYAVLDVGGRHRYGTLFRLRPVFLRGEKQGRHARTAAQSHKKRVFDSAPPTSGHRRGRQRNRPPPGARQSLYGAVSFGRTLIFGNNTAGERV